jgi:hypothetical protein
LADARIAEQLAVFASLPPLVLPARKAIDVPIRVISRIGAG